MVTLPIVLLIFISSNQQDHSNEEPLLGTTPAQPNVKILTDVNKKTAAAVAVGSAGSSLSSEPNIKIIGDILGKNTGTPNFDNVSGSPPRQANTRIMVENSRKTKSGETVVTNGSSQVNDLSISNFKFPDDNPAKSALEGKKIIREKVVPDGKETKGKAPVPLYSLVKNECGEGYALDVNGVCQKTITVRSGKTFDSERRRRRKRFIPDFKFTGQKDLKSKPSKRQNVDCEKLYPGLIHDGVGGCVKEIH